MESIREALDLLRQQAVILSSLRPDSANRVREERDLYLIRRRLARYPAALQAIAFAARELHRPVDTLSVRDVQRLM